MQSHALSFFHLSSPDLLLGMDADPAKRNIFGVMRKSPRAGARRHPAAPVRPADHRVAGGKRIHPAWVVPGGVNEPLTAETRDQILAAIPEALAIAQRTLDWFKSELENFREEIRTFANFPTLFMGLVGPDGGLDHYDGKLRFVDGTGQIVADQRRAADYGEYIGERSNPWTYLKTPYYKPLGYPDGIYRVGPLARLNVVDRCGTPLADQEWAEFRELDARRGAQLVPLPLRAADRDPLRHRTHRAAAGRRRTS